MPAALILALSLFAQDAPISTGSSASTETSVASALASRPRGAPSGDYELVAWCYGALRGYLDMHDEVMPEVRRIEGAYRRPGSNLADDLKVYDDQQKQGRKDLVKFQSAITAAEKASLRPINQQGAEALRRGRAVWTAGPEVTKARKAQEWMSWSLPAVCLSTAKTLDSRSALAGAALRVNADVPSATDQVAPGAEAPPVETLAGEVPVAEAPILSPIGAAPPPAPEAPAAETPATETPAGGTPVAEAPLAAEPAPAAATTEAAPAADGSPEAERPWTRRLRKRQEAAGQPE